MLSRIQKLFAPPVFEDDEDKTRIAKVLNTLLVTIMLFLLFVAITTLPFVFVEKLGNLLLGLGFFLTLVLAYWQMRRGHVRLASAMFVAGLWIVFTIFLLFAGAMTSIVAVFYVAGTVMAGLLLGTRAALIHTTACGIAGLGMVILESSGRSLPRIFPIPVSVGWIDLMLSLVLTTTVLNLVLRGLNDALALARQRAEERKRAEEGQRKALAEALQATHALRESEARLRILFDSAQDNILIHSVSADGLPGRYIEVNQSTCETLGYSRQELLTMGPRDTTIISDPAQIANISQSILQDGQARFEAIGRAKDGREIPVEIRTHLLPMEDQQLFMTISRDITERIHAEEVRQQAEETLRESHHRLEAALVELKETQEQMLHQERLVAVGQLAAGIAHDFNNILATIVLYTQMSLRAADLSPQIRQRLETISQQTDRAADLVQQILDFARQAVLERHPLALDSFLKKVVELLRRTLPESIRIDLTSAKGAGEYLINADPSRIQQALVNLALNARNAMPNGGELGITLSRTAGREIRCVDCGPVIGEEWVQITVTDTGTGIAADILPRIFEPFFTTRAPLGHGLGLSQVYGIVKQHEGHIDVETQVGQGTTFRLYWPVLAVTRPRGEIESSPEIAQGQGETILVLEDNPTMRTALVDILDELGYRVLATADGQEALTICEQHADEIALILSDWVMPSMSGLELVRELIARHVTTKVLMLTVHPLAEEVKKTVAPNVVAWVQKPLDLEQLTKAVARALAESQK